MKRLITKLIIVFTIVTCILNIVTIKTFANIDKKDLYSKGDCGRLLKKGDTVVKTYIVVYNQNGKEYPAYCLDKNKAGVDDNISYDVTLDGVIKNVYIWKAITNGYPYKTIEQLGCSNKEEAFSATKQAIYCYIHGNDPNGYTGIGEAGNRTVRAIKQILADAENCNETQISNNVNIIKEQEVFDIDNKDKNYVSKIYSIKAGTTISNYKVQITKVDEELPEDEEIKDDEMITMDEELPEGIRIADINNNEKTEFSSEEKFKILIPIKNLTKENNFNIEIQTKINTKPVLYGQAPNTSYQDYALTAATYEDASAKSQDKFYKNETKLKIIKQDEETKKRLENVEFNVMDSNKNVIYANLKTNSKGEIEITNLLPGKYYIREVNAKEGYLLSNEMFEIDINFNEEFTIIVNNSFKEEEEQEPNITKQEISHKVENVKKLPVTGM